MIIGICLSDDDNCVYLVSMMCLDLYVYLYTAYSFVVANVCVFCVCIGAAVLLLLGGVSVLLLLQLFQVSSHPRCQHVHKSLRRAVIKLFDYTTTAVLCESFSTLGTHWASSTRKIDQLHWVSWMS